MISASSPHSDKVVIWGMSCAGKTTFAKLMTEHQYYCFDALFDWHAIEALGLSMNANFEYIRSKCESNRYVLDGWHLGDKQGKWLPSDVTLYVVYASYDKIIGQYRVPVEHFDQYRHMFRRWYDEIPSVVPVRFFLNTGRFVETTPQEFTEFLRRS